MIKTATDPGIGQQQKRQKKRRMVQTVIYAPHFILIMVVCGMIRIFLSPYGGLMNLLLGTQADFMTVPEAFRTIYIASGIWQDVDGGTIVYLATLSAVDPGLYEAAKIDGTSMFQRILNIDLLELTPMIILQLIMSASGLMSIGFEKVFLLQTQLNKATSDVIAVYVYEQGIVSHMYSYLTEQGITYLHLMPLLMMPHVSRQMPMFPLGTPIMIMCWRFFAMVKIMRCLGCSTFLRTTSPLYWIGSAWPTRTCSREKASSFQVKLAYISIGYTNKSVIPKAQGNHPMWGFPRKKLA